jgi:8-oxo-dGTP pyrophosphatase MutT (NUDIX family)
MRFSCTSLIPVDGNKFLAVDCAKGRGIILPGGQLEVGETPKECAKRELYEETGAHVREQKFLWCGPSNPEVFVYTFVTKVYEHYLELVGIYRPEGRVVAATWDDLLKSQFRGHYECLRDVYERTL